MYYPDFACISSSQESPLESSELEGHKAYIYISLWVIYNSKTIYGSELVGRVREIGQRSVRGQYNCFQEKGSEVGRN